MPRNDRSDSLSVRGDDDPRRVMKGMQQEAEVELGWSEARDTGGVEHQGPADRAGVDRERRPEDSAKAFEETTEVQRAPDAPGASEHP